MARVLTRYATLAALASALLVSTHAEAPAGHKGAVIGGLVVGAAVGAALSKKHRHNTKIYVPGYAPYPPGGYVPAWQQTFSPKPGVICYPAQRACYDGGGAYNPKWTWKTFSR